MTYQGPITIRKILDETAYNRVYQGDCVEIMETMPDACIDLIFADPPYNLQLQKDLYRPDTSRVDAVREEWDRFDTLDAYDLFTHRWLQSCRRILKKTGTIWVIGSYHNIFRVGAMMQDEGFWILNDVIWRKTNPMPNFRGRRFTNAHETLIWATKSNENKNYRFNYEAMKTLNDGVQMRYDDWHIPICSGNERIKTPTGAKAHPTQKPEALLKRILLASSAENDLVLDPFFGVGTTGAVAVLLARRYIGIEKEKEYIDLARQRIAKTMPLAPEARMITANQRSEMRIPFGWIVERGLLEPGGLLFDHTRRHVARIRADGTVVSGEVSGSIHHVGAMVTGQASCNGWTYWHFDIERKLLPIDILRKKIRADLASSGNKQQ